MYTEPYNQEGAQSPKQAAHLQFDDASVPKYSQVHTLNCDALCSRILKYLALQNFEAPQSVEPSGAQKTVKCPSLTLRFHQCSTADPNCLQHLQRYRSLEINQFYWEAHQLWMRGWVQNSGTRISPSTRQRSLTCRTHCQQPQAHHHSSSDVGSQAGRFLVRNPIDYTSLDGPAMHSDGMATPAKIYFATGNNKKLQEVGEWCVNCIFCYQILLARCQSLSVGATQRWQALSLVMFPNHTAVRR